MHIHLLTLAAAWIGTHSWLFAAGVVLLGIVGVPLAGWSAGRSVRKGADRALAAQGRRARSLGLDLTYRESDLLDRLERRRWRNRKGRR
jgi:hypothetical protein